MYFRMASSSDRHLACRFFSLARMLYEQVRTHANGRRLSTMQIQALLHAREHQGSQMQALAQSLGIAPPSATALANGLIKLGLLRRIQDKHDRRSWRLALTPKGTRLLEQRLELIASGLACVTSGLSATERQTLLRILTKVTDGVKSH